MGNLPKNGAIIKSIVTGDMGRAIAKEYGVTLCSQMVLKNKNDEFPNMKEQVSMNLFLAYDESIGYNTGTFVRDKDAVSSAMLLCEAAAYYKTKGKTLLDVLNEIFEKYGYYKEKQISLVLEGAEGKARIDRMMESYRKDFPQQIGNLKKSHILIILKDTKVIPTSNVFIFILMMALVSIRLLVLA
jgi:phosphoglucomutase